MIREDTEEDRPDTIRHREVFRGLWRLLSPRKAGLLVACFYLTACTVSSLAGPILINLNDALFA